MQNIFNEETTFRDAALYWFEFGFQVIPVIPGTKKPAVKWDSWLENLSKETINAYWNEHPNNELAFIVGSGVVVFDTDSEEASKAMLSLMKKYNMYPLMVVKTECGSHYYFRLEAGAAIKMDSHSTTEHPERIDVKTGRGAVMLPPSKGKALVLLQAENVSELAPANQDFIDAVFIHNGRPVPSAAKSLTKTKTVHDSNMSSLSGLERLLDQIDPDVGYQDWLNVIMAVNHETDGSDEGLNLVDAWSGEGDKYKGRSDVEVKWRSLRSELENPITVATLFSLAIDNVEPFERCKTTVVHPVVERLLAEVVNDSAAPLEQDAIDALAQVQQFDPDELPRMHAIQKANIEAPAVKKTTSAHDQVAAAQSKTLIKAIKKLKVEGFPNAPEREGGAPQVTLANISYLLGKYKITARYNVIKKKAEFSVCNLAMLPDTIDNSILAYIKSLGNLNHMYSPDVLNFATTVCSANPHNPIADWIQSEPWDGVDRLPDIYDTLKTDQDFPEALKIAIIKRWLLSAVAAACTPVGFRARGLLTLQGKQGLGKTQWFASLAKKIPSSDVYVLLGQHLDIAQKDDVLTSIKHWIVELGELDSTFRKDIAGLKAFITKDCDQVRPHYHRTDSVFPRRTVYGGSVNSAYFLVDNTGNSRFWTLPVTGINYDHNVNMQQLFAQLHVEFLNGEQWWLTSEEETLLDVQNQSHIATSPIQELVRSNFDIVRIGEEGLPAYGARELLLELGIKEPNNAQSRECGEVLRELTGKPKRIQGYDKWRVPLIEGTKFANL